MPCDSKLKTRQTIQQRAEEIRRAVAGLSTAITSGRVRVIVGPQGAIAFEGWTEAERDGVTDACAYRKIMVAGSALVKAAIARAEQMAGRAVDRRVVAHGVHSHDGGASWHRKG